MKILCPNCKNAYNIDDKIIPEEGAHVKCNYCDVLFSINRDSGICPKCGHNRKINDLECPKCGIVFEKNQKYFNDIKSGFKNAEEAFKAAKENQGNFKWKEAIEKAYRNLKVKWKAAIEKSNRNLDENNEIRKKASEKASEKTKQREDTELILMRDMNDSQKMVFLSEMNKFRLNRTTGFLLTVFLGGFGAHHFYMGNVSLGVTYLLFCWTFIPEIISLIELFSIMKKIDAYNDEKAKEIAAKVINTIK